MILHSHRYVFMIFNVLLQHVQELKKVSLLPAVDMQQFVGQPWKGHLATTSEEHLMSVFTSDKTR